MPPAIAESDVRAEPVAAAISLGVAPSCSAVEVAVADSETLFRRGVAELIRLDKRLVVVGEATDGEQAVLMCSRLQPDVVLIGLRLRGLSCLAAAARIARPSSRTRVIILAETDSEALVADAVQAGASGYVLRDCEPDGLLASVLAVAQGRRVRCAHDAGSVRELVLSSEDEANASRLRVNASDRMLLVLIAGGASNREIAARLRVSDKTVRNRVSQLYHKLGLRDRSHAFAYAQVSGMVGRL